MKTTIACIAVFLFSNTSARYSQAMSRFDPLRKFGSEFSMMGVDISDIGWPRPVSVQPG